MLLPSLSRRVFGMKKIVVPLAATALVLLLSLGVSGSMPKDAQALTGKPNFVFILADDMRKDDLKYMPKTRAIRKQGHELRECLCRQRPVLSQPGHHHERPVLPQHRCVDQR